MIQQKLLTEICQTYSKNLGRFSLSDQAVISLLNDQFSLPFHSKFKKKKQVEKNAVKRIGLWKSFYKDCLLYYFSSSNHDQKELHKKWFELSEDNIFKEFKLEQAYHYLTAYILKIPIDLNLIVFDKDLKHTSFGSSWKLLETPFADWQCELAILYLIISQLTHKVEFLEAAQKLTLQQIDFLDYKGRYQRACLTSQHINSFINAQFSQAVLFHSMAKILKCPKLNSLAKLNLDIFSHLDEDQKLEISLESLLQYKLLNTKLSEFDEFEDLDLPKVVHNEGLAYLNFRKHNMSLSASLMGVNTSMGSYVKDDVQILAFGPQTAILGEGQLFGAIGSSPQSKHKNFEIAIDEKSFQIKSSMGLPRIDGSKSYLDCWQFSQDWLDCSINFQGDELSIDVSPLSLGTKIYFVFYVLCEKCLINGEEKILPNTLNQYHGAISPVTLVGQNNSLTLDSKGDNEMKVIPLEGKKSFWGANYLIAYHLNKKYSTFKWKIRTE